MAGSIKSSTNAAPRLLPLTVLSSALLWFFTTTGGRQIFVQEVLGGAYDSQAEHFLRGDVDVDAAAIAHEAMIVNNHVRMYFGPFPAFLRVPLNFLYPAGHGKWSRTSGFCAGVLALFAFAGLVSTALRSSALSPGARTWLGSACVIGFALGSPLLLLLGNLSIYNEAIIWGLALSLAALYFAVRSRAVESGALARSLFGFSLCAGGALLSRVTFGLPFILVAFLLAGSSKEGRVSSRAASAANCQAVANRGRMFNSCRFLQLSVLFLPLGAALAFYMWLSYAKFGNLTGVNFDYYINPVHAAFAHKFGVFSPRRIPYSFADYFNPRLPSFQSEPPFLAADRHSYDYPSLYSNNFSEVYLSLLWGSPWLIFGAIMGIVCLVRRIGVGAFERATAAALFAQFLCILSFFALAQRYAAELCPFLIFCLVVFLRSGRALLLHTRYLLIGLVIVSVVVNTLTTVSWLVDADMNVPRQTRAAWEKMLGRRSYEKWK